MKNIDWTVQKMAALLGKHFLGKMLGHFRGNREATVRLGEMGAGIMPNYQIRLSDNVVNTYRGASHKRFEQAEFFDPDHLSQPFSYSDIEEARGLAPK